MAINLGNVVGLLRSTTAPAKKYVLWGKILNPLYPDIVELNYWDDVSMAWIPLTDPTTQYWLRPVIDVRTTAPGSPLEGDRYLIGASASGTWAGKDDQVATFKAGNWVYQIPLDGFIVSVRTLANSLYDYRGTYGAGGVWVLDDFSVPVAPGTYIPMTQKGQALGVAPLDSGTKISYTFIEGSTLPYTPLNPASWPPGLDNVWDGVEYLRLLLAGGGPGVPSLADILLVGNDAGGLSIVNLLDPTNPQDAATKAYVDSVSSTIPDASPTVKGIMKLYTVTGTNTDGTMDQNSITTSLASKVSTSLALGKILVGNSIGIATPVDLSQDATIDDAGVVSVAWVNGYSTYDARYAKLSGSTFTGDVILNADPTLALGAATKSYVDNLITGLTWKNEVVCKTTANITLSGEQTIDGILTSSSRVLVSNQTTQSQNGLYLSSSGAWTRVIDADTGVEIVGATVLVLSGTLYASTQWSCNNTAITLGVTSITFIQIAGAGVYTNGTGLTLTGNVFSVTTNGITYSLFQQVAASSLVGNPTGSLANAQGITLGSTLAFSSSTLQTGAISGDVVSSANSFATTLATNIVSNSKFRQSVGLSVVGNSTNATANVADIVGTNNQVLRVSGTTLGFGSIDLSQSATVGSSILGLANGGTGSSTAFSNGSVIFIASGIFSQNNNSFYFASNLLSVNTGGDFGGTDSIDVYNQVDAYLPNSSQGAITSSGGTSGFTSSSSRGTGASPVNLNAGDLVGGFSMWGYTNSAYTNVAGAFAYVTGSTSANLGGEYRIYTKGDGGSLTQRFTLDNAGRAKVNSGGMDIVGAGTTTGVTWQLFQSDGVTNIAKYSDNGQHTHNLTFGTAGANNVNLWSSVMSATLRSTASDNMVGHYINPTFTLGSTTQNPIGLNLDVTYIQTGGISTTVAPPNTTLAGMTATTYTNVAPASTSGSGTGALFTVVVGSATSITSVTQTAAGSGYKVMETITFNGSQFGSGSGSAIYTIRTVTGVSLGTTAVPLRVGITGAHYLDSPHSIDFYNGGVYAGGIGYSNVGGAFTQAIGFFDATSVNFAINNSNGAVFSKAVSVAGTFTATSTASLSGNTTISAVLTSTYINVINGATANAGFLNSGTSGGIATVNNFQSRFKAAGTIGATTGGVGIPSAISLTFGGTGYTTGIKATTGGTGTGFQVTVSTVSSGVVTAITFSALIGGAANGSGYTINDVLTISTGGANATFTVTAVDYAGTIMAFEDFNNYTDARSNNLYVSFYSRPTYNITSTQTGTIAGLYFNPTLTATGSFNVYGVIIVPITAKNGWGVSGPTAKMHIGGAMSATTWTTTGIQMAFDAATYTDTGTAGTRATGVVIGIARPTFASTNAVTVTDAATVYIANDVAQGTNMTLTRTHALWVAAGLARFDGGIKGSVTNDAAAAGNYGEEFNSAQSTYTNYTTTATYQNIASITLTAGDWDISAFATFSSNTATITAAANAIFVISTTTASAAGSTEGVNIAYIPQATLLGTSLESIDISRYRISLSGTTTYYLNTQATFTLGNPQFVGSIKARRVR